MTTKAVSAETRDLLVKLCGMLGSDFEGERAAAALKITGLLRQAGLCWDDILPTPAGASRAAASPAPNWSRGDGKSPHRSVDWRADLACCDRYRSWLTKSELEYVEGLRAVVRSGRLAVRATDMTKLAVLARRIRRQLSERRPHAEPRSEARA